MEALSVIVADSQMKQLQATVKALSAQEGIEVVDTARNGYETVSRVFSRQPDVLLMEMSLETPQAGFLVLREMQSVSANSCVVFYSHIQDDETVCRALAEGASNYLFKPQTPEVLVRACRNAFQGIHRFSPQVCSLLLENYRQLYDLQKHMASLIRITSQLTATEREILQLLYSGMQTREIERVRFIEHTTMKSHLSHIIHKFGGESIQSIISILQAAHFVQYLD